MPKEIKDIQYCQHQGEHPHYKHKLDLYLPEERKGNRQNLFVLFVHGGGWKRGDKNFWRGMNSNVGKKFAAEGIPTAVMSYRLSTHTLLYTMLFGIFWGICFGLVFYGFSFLLDFILNLFSWMQRLRALNSLLEVVFENPLQLFGGWIILGMIWMYFGHERSHLGVTFEKQLEDVASAFKWIIKQSEQYTQVKNPKIVIMGHSAGGHLVTMFSLALEKYLEEEKEYSKYLAGVIGVSGVYHLGRMWKNPFLRYWYILAAFHTHFEKEKMREVSPLTHAKRVPFPVLLLNASIDFHLKRDGEDLCRALREAGTKVEHHILPRKTHHTIIADIGKPSRDNISPIILNFLDQL